MSTPFLSRRMIALLAAYVVALQALLLPLAVSAQAVFSHSLCSESATDSQPSRHHEPGCPCASGCGMACCGQALLEPPQAAVVIARTSTCVSLRVPAIAPALRPAGHGPQIPRAPPAA